MSDNLNSSAIIADIEEWAWTRNFSAPYGILTGSHVNRKGVKYQSITFGRARTLDATVEVYNRKFMILRTSRHGSQFFKDYASLQTALAAL